MNLPKQSLPVRRSVSTAGRSRAAVTASDIPCTACCTACSLLPWPASAICKKGCEAAIPGCRC